MKFLVERQEIGRAFVSAYHRWEVRIVDPPRDLPYDLTWAWGDRKNIAISALGKRLKAHFGGILIELIVQELPRRLVKVKPGGMP